MFADTFAQSSAFWEQRIAKELKAPGQNPLLNPELAAPAPVAAIPRPTVAALSATMAAGSWPRSVGFDRIEVREPGGMRPSAFAAAPAEPLVFGEGVGNTRRVGHLHRGPGGAAAWTLAPTPTAEAPFRSMTPQSSRPPFGSTQRHGALSLAVQQETPIFSPGAMGRPRADLSPTQWLVSRSAAAADPRPPLKRNGPPGF